MTKLVMIVVVVYFNVNCFIGTQRDTCRYNLHESTQSINCNFIGAGLQSVNNTNDPDVAREREETTNYFILECLRYYQRLQECDKEENRYIPSIYGINTNPVSPSEAEVLSKRL
ncbi:hypothetical protein [Leptospira alstonii]|uniref:hypothetical protein n=1 Tax=Leptospira alstonii TaxID=28452 RepID=UPI000562561F|nr:hypothetical protein [Leptospira alstonii]